MTTQPLSIKLLKFFFLFVNLIGHSLYAAGLDATPALAPGYRELGFNAPEPGTYQLPFLGPAGDGEVVDSNGKPTTLYKLMKPEGAHPKVILLSFIYSTCHDVNGCPLATAVFHKIKTRLVKEPELAARLALLTLSFNPDYDTPQRMHDYGANFQGDNIDWRFLTTRSEQALKPILEHYPQLIEKVYDAKGGFTNTFNHNLRVFLIDPQQQVRNIYNTELLHADTVLSDIKTLLTEAKVNNTGKDELVNLERFQAGDDKKNYASQAYQTRSLALAERIGVPADLLKNALKPALGLPTLPVPDNNSLTAEKIALGRKLFFDRRLSLNNTFSCAMCHVPEQGFASNEMATAVGVEGRSVRRNSPTLYNVAYQRLLFHDGRESLLEQQVWGPLLAQNEMANPSIGYVINKINASPDYTDLFKQAFGKPTSMETIGMALASYERTLNSASSPFDQWYYGKQDNALNDQAKRGFALFTGKAGCSRCHQVNKDYALFTDQDLHNTGIGYADTMAQAVPATSRKVQLAPGIFADVPVAVINSVSSLKNNDLGRYEITQKPEDRWRYKTPSLRNVNLTAPYMHNGSLATLKEVVEFYNRGDVTNVNLDPLLKPLALTPQEIDDIVVFLQNLTGDNVNNLVSDAFAAPVGDAK